MHLYEKVNRLITEALSHYGFEGRASTRTLTGEFDRQVTEVMALANHLGQPSLEIAEKIAARLREHPEFSAVEVAGKGHINLRLSNETVCEYALSDLFHVEPTGKSYVIDFGAPNIAKELHVGHLRSLVIGESLRRILIMRGNHVTSDIHLGDFGVPMGMLLAELIQRYPLFGTAPEHTPDGLAEMLETMYPEVVTACKADESLMARAYVMTREIQSKASPQIHNAWQIIRDASMAKIMPNIDRLGAHFDLLNGESDAAYDIPIVEQLLKDDLRYDDGAMIVDVALDTDKKKLPPLIFRKGDDNYTYAATDLATIVKRRGHDLIYVVDARQTDHFEQVFRVAKRFHSASMTHVSFGTVNGPDGKPLKTRDGGVPSLQWMLDTAVAKATERSAPDDAEKIGIGALKFADLITHRVSGYKFDLDKMVIPEGKTGPYVQYACVRILAILRKHVGVQFGDVILTHPTERGLLLTCANYPEALMLAETHLSPTFLADYVFTLAQKFSSFYKECTVKDAEPEIMISRLAICEKVYQVLVEGLHLLGIEIPEKM